MTEQQCKIVLPSVLDIESSMVDDSFRQQYEGVEMVSLKSIIPKRFVDTVKHPKYGANYIALAYPQHQDESRMTLVDSSLQKGSFEWTQVPQGTQVITDPKDDQAIVGLVGITGG